jgi:hypothetical protein
MSMDQAASSASPTRFALDIGSTVVKLAGVGGDGALLWQRFFPRDFDAGIARQVTRLLEEHDIDVDHDPVLACSSANGGLRVGVICLSHHFSGAALRNQVLLAGANPLFKHICAKAGAGNKRGIG